MDDLNESKNNDSEKPPAVLMPALLCIAIAFIFFLPRYCDHNNLSRIGIEVIGVVVHVERVRWTEGADSFVSLLQYEFNGHLYIYRFVGNLRSGSEYLLLVNPDNPEHVRRKDGFSYKIMFWWFIFVGIAVFFFPFIKDEVKNAIVKHKYCKYKKIEINNEPENISELISANEDLRNKITELFRPIMNDVIGLHLFDKIPEKKIRKACKYYVPKLVGEERVIILYDNTIFNSGKEGFTITTNTLSVNNMLGSKYYVKLNEISIIELKQFENDYKIIISLNEYDKKNIEIEIPQIPKDKTEAFCDSLKKTIALLLKQQGK